MAARYCDGDGWHKASGLCVYIENGLVRRYYEENDREVKIIEMEKPCRLHALRVRRYRHRLKAEKEAAEVKKAGE